MSDSYVGVSASEEMHVPSGQGKLQGSKYYLLRDEDKGPNDIGEEIVIGRMVDETNHKIPEAKICRKDFYEGEDIDQATYYGHPLYNTLEEARIAFGAETVQYTDIYYLDGTIETGFATKIQYSSGIPVAVIHWVNRSITNVSLFAVKNIEVLQCRS